MEAAAVAPISSFSLYVGNLAADVNEQQLWETFSVIGNVASVKICRDCVTRRSLCYGYVNFTSAESAEQAHKELNFTLIKGRPCRVMRSQRDPLKRKNGEGNLMVKNLNKTTTDRQLYEAFCQFGSVLSCKISKDNSTGESRGFGFVQFEEEDVAKKLQDNQQTIMVNGNKVEIVPFIRKSERTPHEVPITNLYVKNFPKEWTEETLTSIFSVFGEITSLALNKDNKGRPFGFINYAETESAEEALDDSNGRICTETGLKPVQEETEEDKKVLPLEEDGLLSEEVPEGVQRIYVSRAQSKFERESALRSKFEQKVATRTESTTGVVLYVKNLPDDKTDNDLKELFSASGTVLSTYVMRDPKGTSRGFGFVTMATKDDATRAISELHSRLIGGKPLFVCLHEKKDSRRLRLAEEFSRPRLFAGFTGNNQMMNVQGNAGGMGGSGHIGGGNRNGGIYGGRGNRRPFAAPAHPMMNTLPIPQQHLQFMMQQQQIFAQQQQQQQQQLYMQQQAAVKLNNILSLDENTRRQLLGEHIYARVQQHHPNEAAKVTGMMLEMDHTDIVAMLQDEARLNAKVNEALTVLETAIRQQ